MLYLCAHTLFEGPDQVIQPFPEGDRPGHVTGGHGGGGRCQWKLQRRLHYLPNQARMGREMSEWSKVMEIGLS